ncbi:MAG TPA: hypothetical protein VG604_01560 [Candidatus Saccharimonadales bacterium]|nr:hypothetical protein [Candidatus Saccharimonadales bacterium]
MSMNHEHFPGCGHVPEDVHHDHEHHGHHEHAHPLGSIACGVACQCHALNPSSNPFEFDAEQHAQELLLKSKKEVDSDESDLVYDPKTGRWSRRKAKDNVQPKPSAISRRFATNLQ